MLASTALSVEPHVVELGPAATATLSLQLTASTTLSGRLLRDGHPAVGVAVHTSLPDQPDLEMAPSYTQADGRFVVRTLPGTVRLIADDKIVAPALDVAADGSTTIDVDQ